MIAHLTVDELIAIYHQPAQAEFARDLEETMATVDDKILLERCAAAPGT
jgi:hypothetical protein